MRQQQHELLFDVQDQRLFDILTGAYDFAFGMNWQGPIADDRTAAYGKQAM